MDESTLNLIKACRKGNQMAQLSLYEQHARRLYAACLRIIGNTQEAEEAMQDAFLKIFTRIDQYHDGLCFEAWMQRIAIHTAIDYVRKQSMEWEELTDKHVDTYANDEDDTNEDAVHYSVQQVKDCMQQLSAGYRLVLSLYLFEGYDMEEIASILKIQPVSVRSQYLRAKKKLLELIPCIQYG